MSKPQNVLRYYVLCNILKNTIRTGWTNWNVKRERVESVAEHIFSVQMLAIAMQSEYQYDIDLQKVIMMLAVHELEEILIGDLTMFQVSKEEKITMGHKAIEDVLSSLLNKDQIIGLIKEFDAKETPEALFAYRCDKLECDLQSKLYDEENCVDLNNQDGNSTMEHPIVKELLDSGMTWSEMWLAFGQKVYNYDQNFREVSSYAMQNNIGILAKHLKK